MNTDSMIMVLILLLVVVVLCGAAAYLMLQKLTAKKELKVELKANKDFLYSFYGLAIRFGPLRRYILKIRKRIELLDLSDDWTISRKTMRFTLITLGMTFLVFLFLLFFSRNLYFLIISLFTVYMLHNQLIRMLVDKIDSRLLKQFEALLGNVRHHYHEHGMIDEAIYDSMEECDYEISMHANRMYEILTASDVDDRIEQYSETAPNKFMKTFIAMSYLVQRFGDKLVDGKSIYLSNLNYLKQEISLELLRREKLGYLFQSLSAIAVFPIFTLKPLETWATSNIPELKEYYDGAYGFIAMIVLFVLVFAAYQLIAKLQTNSEYTHQDNALYAFALKMRFLNHLIEGMVEKNHYRSMKVDKLLKKTGTKISVNQFYCKQILFSACTFLFSLGIFINVHAIVRHNLLYSSPNLKMAASDAQINLQDELRLIESDRKMILYFKGKNATFHEIDTVLLESKEYATASQSGIAAKRILTKLTAYNRHTLQWWELLLSFVLAAFSFYMPWWMLLFRERVMRMQMEDEVMQFHTIILMLMHMERIDVENILSWMEQFADIFKSAISKCINNYEYGDRQALEQLALDEPYTPFVRIVENLQSAADKITLEHAFDELKMEREYYHEKRKQDNEMLVNRKGMWGKLIAFIPLGATVFLYLIIPFVMVSAAQLMDFSEEINRVL